MPDTIADALNALRIPDPSPALTIVRKATEKGEEFTLKHEPMPCPELPPLAARVKAGRRAHRISTLTDLQKFVDASAIKTDGPICFYSDTAAQVVLDHDGEDEKEVIGCSLDRHPEFTAWDAMNGETFGHAAFMNLLREHGEGAIGEDAAEYAFLVGTFASLTGTLTHDAEEFLDSQARSANFVVKRKKRGGAADGEETNVENVPTEFNLRVPVLLDDAERLACRVMVRMTGAQGGGIQFTLIFVGFDEAVTKHINARLAKFAETAGFLCVRGQYIEQPWTEPQLPKSIVQLMEQQTNAIRAMAAMPR